MNDHDECCPAERGCRCEELEVRGEHPIVALRLYPFLYQPQGEASGFIWLPKQRPDYCQFSLTRIRGYA